jgi:hypothetical protein
MPLAAPTPTLAESAPALDHAVTPSAAAVPLALADLPPAQSVTLSIALTDIPAERPPAAQATAVILDPCPPTDAASPPPSHALPESVQDVTLAKTTSAPTTPSPLSPSAPPRPTRSPLLPRRDLCLLAEPAVTTSALLPADGEIEFDETSFALWNELLQAVVCHNMHSK